MFYDMDAVRALRIELDNVFQKYMKNTTFIDTTQRAKPGPGPRKLSKAALRQIEKVFGTDNPMTKYDPLPKRTEEVDDIESDSESETESVDINKLEQISEKINKSIESEKEEEVINPMAKYDPKSKKVEKANKKKNGKKGPS